MRLCRLIDAEGSRSLIKEPLDECSLVLRREVAVREGQVVLGLGDDDDSTLSPRAARHACTLGSTGVQESAAP